MGLFAAWGFPELLTKLCTEELQDIGWKLKKNPKNLEKLHWNFVVSFDLFSLWPDSALSDNGRKSESHIYSSQSPGRKEEAAHLQLSPRQRRGHRGAWAGISSPTALPLPEDFKSAFPRTTRAQCNRNSLLEAWDTRVSLESNSSLGTSKGLKGPNHISMEHGAVGASQPLCTTKSPPAPNICCWELSEPLHLILWWQYKEDTATHNFHPSTLLLASSSPRSE